MIEDPKFCTLVFEYATVQLNLQTQTEDIGISYLSTYLFIISIIIKYLGILYTQLKLDTFL